MAQFELCLDGASGYMKMAFFYPLSAYPKKTAPDPALPFGTNLYVGKKLFIRYSGNIFQKSLIFND
jgi:hypothetical protein